MHLTTERGTTVVLHDLGGLAPAAAPAVLVCHATGFCGRAYEPLAARLATWAHVWALDFPGHGETPAPADGVVVWRSWTGDVTAAVAAIRATGAGEVHAVGHSMGGAVALQAEAETPGLFASAYLYEPIITESRARITGTNVLSDGARRRRAVFPSRQAALWRYASRPPLGDVTAGTLAAYVQHGFEDLPDGTVRLRCLPEYEAAVFEASGDLTYASVAAATLPVVLAAGAVARELPPASFAAALAGVLPAATLSWQENLGHFGPFQAPDVIAADILRHLPGR